MYLSDYKSNGSPKADLLFICASLLLKEELTCEEDALLELSLSGIYNYLNPYMKKVYQEKLNRSPPSTVITTTTATNSVAEAMTGVRNLLDSEKDMDDILYKVQLEKARLVKEKLRHSDMYKALAILEKITKVDISLIISLLFFSVEKLAALAAKLQLKLTNNCFTSKIRQQRMHAK
ncbi:hypothetical protein BCV72DRAFT_218375 [Rhizopus microsporus var. microsporus]|uniref:Uncharacterized protein n=1 Tax=Rhizopus microsporus var. microsporus TaxID=86635 RepID=A0A1X0QM76_RHIZD|nr:hypothetical protein BCV72DRAFT_218375 [Rhizopus microsporus var. microsporus]